MLGRNPLIAFGTALVLAAGPAWAEAAERGYGGHMWNGGGWGHFIFGPLMMILFLAVIVAIVVLLVRWIGGTGGGGAPRPGAGGAPRPGDGARDLLDERYAKGEIDRDEYLQRKKDLS